MPAPAMRDPLMRCAFILLVAGGETEQDASRALGISQRTVKRERGRDPQFDAQVQWAHKHPLQAERDEFVRLMTGDATEQAFAAAHLVMNTDKTVRLVAPAPPPPSPRPLPPVNTVAVVVAEPVAVSEPVEVDAQDALALESSVAADVEVVEPPAAPRRGERVIPPYSREALKAEFWRKLHGRTVPDHMYLGAAELLTRLEVSEDRRKQRPSTTIREKPGEIAASTEPTKKREKGLRQEVWQEISENFIGPEAATGDDPVH